MINILVIKKFHIRGFYEVLTALFFFTALILLPISEVYTLLMTNPFFVTIFAFLFLKEKVGIRRWAAVIIGFIGVVVVIYPQNFNFNYIFLFPIISAIFLTIRDIATKTLATKKLFTRSLFASEDILPGMKLTEKNIRLKKPAGGLSFQDFSKLLGKKITKKVKCNEMLTLEHFK